LIQGMPRPRPPHLHREVTRHGKAVWYVRVGRGGRIRIKSEFGTPDFDAEYQAAVTGQPKAAKGRSSGTLAWLFERYRETPAWRGLSLATRKQREAIIAQVIGTAGNQPFAKITRATVIAARDRRAATPAQARHFLETMRGLFKWAAKASMVKVDPTIGVEDPARPKGSGFPRMDRASSCCLRAPLAAGNAPARVARCASLHRPSPRRRRTDRFTPAARHALRNWLPNDLLSNGFPVAPTMKARSPHVPAFNVSANTGKIGKVTSSVYPLFSVLSVAMSLRTCWRPRRSAWTSQDRRHTGRERHRRPA
jgi:hypothetical protein